MTKYFLELGMKLPQVNTVILKDSTNPKTGKEFFEKLIEYYQEKYLEDSKYQAILNQIKDRQAEFTNDNAPVETLVEHLLSPNLQDDNSDEPEILGNNQTETEYN